MRFAPLFSSLDDLHLPAVCARADTRRGYPALEHPDTARAVAMELLRTSTRFRIDLLAYCVMPDHVHLLVAGRTPDADLSGAVGRWKQLTGRRHRAVSARTLWRPRCREWLLADLAGVCEAAAVILEEPVRAGLAARAEHYPWSAAAASLLERMVLGRQTPPPEWWPAERQRLMP